MPPLPLAIDPGFHLGDSYTLLLLFLGVAVFAAIGALTHQEERAFSASIVYLGLGMLAALVQQLFGLPALDPLEDAAVLQRVSELALIVAVFAAGISLERLFERSSLVNVGLLLGVVMPLGIAAVALFGVAVMGLSLGAAIILGAILAPTDPVLAGDVGVGPPGSDQRGEPRGSLTAEAAANDGLASPFVVLGLFVAAEGGTGWIWEWLLADLLYAGGVALLLGAVAGYGIAAAIVRLRDGGLLAPELDRFVAVATVLVVYGLVEALGAYGLVAVFAAAIAFRRYEFAHEYNRRVHDGAETASTFFELAVLLFLGSAVTVSGLATPGVAGWLLALLLILVVRPVTVLALVGRGSMRPGERVFLAWFGVRGVAALFYAAVVVESDVLSRAEVSTVFWTTAACVIFSIVVHGLSAASLTSRLLTR